MQRNRQYYYPLKTARPFHLALQKHNSNVAARICPTKQSVCINHSQSITSKPFNNLGSDIGNSQNVTKVKPTPFKVLPDAAVSTPQLTLINNAESPVLSSSDNVTDPER